jgi:hypothetical protein
VFSLLDCRKATFLYVTLDRGRIAAAARAMARRREPTQQLPQPLEE